MIYPLQLYIAYFFGREGFNISTVPPIPISAIDIFLLLQS